MISRSRNATKCNRITCIVTIPETVEVPGRTVQLMSRKLTGVIEAGIEEDGNTKLRWGAKTPDGCSCPICTVSPATEVVLQVLNTAPEALKLHKGTRKGQFTPRKYILQVGESPPTQPEEEAVAATEE